MRAVKAAADAPAPSLISGDPEVFESEQQHRPIYNGRDGRVDPPITLYSSVFAGLKDDLADLSSVTPDPEELRRTDKLFEVSSRVYEIHVSRS